MNAQAVVKVDYALHEGIHRQSHGPALFEVQAHQATRSQRCQRNQDDDMKLNKGLNQVFSVHHIDPLSSTIIVQVDGILPVMVNFKRNQKIKMQE